MRWSGIKGICHLSNQERKQSVFLILVMSLAVRHGGGNLNSLTSKFIIIMYMAAVFTVGCATTSNKDLANCVELILDGEIVRIDEKNHRLFIAGRGITALDVKKKLSQIEKCFVNTPWQQDWALSVFTEAEFAGYKDEKNIIPYHQDNRWAKSYILEYDHFTKSLITNPATNPERLMP